MKKRYYTLDAIRGLALLNMIFFHGLWDLVYIFGYEIKVFDSLIAYIWQQAICWTFIFISGFSYNFSHNKLKRGLIVFALGLVITLVTLIALPSSRIVFGVLTLIGSCMIINVPLYKSLDKVNPLIGFIISISLFILTRNVNDGYLGFEGLNFIKLPSYIYKNLFTSYLGFPNPTFYSTDYFSLIPWIFLFISGYFFKKVLENKNLLSKLETHNNPILEYMGKHSLHIYILHQPILYIVLYLICSL